MTLKSARQGFTLLELLIVLVILTVMTSLVAPNLVGVTENSRAHSEAYTLQKALQRVFDQQWMSRQTSFLQIDQGQLVLWQSVTGIWRPAEVVYTFNDELNYELSYNKTSLSSAQQTVNMSVPMALFV
ncbi:MAG: prepilin-type N-terminal cleavage/methylation domain-containing protein, partial [Marinomonas atlantica]|nr:prepilin-type N-terminal cleavage/methylation domain-containing protein [Marinomonas atlantica]